MSAQVISLAMYRATRSHFSNPMDVKTAPVDLVSDRRSFPRHGKRLEDRRLEPRYDVDGVFTPWILLGNTKLPLKNVSHSGFSIRTFLEKKLGARIVATTSTGKQVSARLIWQFGGLAGFEGPIV